LARTPFTFVPCKVCPVIVTPLIVPLTVAPLWETREPTVTTPVKVEAEKVVVPETVRLPCTTTEPLTVPPEPGK